MGNLSGKKVLMVLSPQNFRDEEFFKTRVALQAKGAIIVNGSLDVEEATGMMGGKARIEEDIGKVNIKDYQALVFVGGDGAGVFFDNKSALQLAKEAIEKGKVLGAICIAPSVLANAGVLKGKKATAFDSEKKNLVSKGAKFTGSQVEVDGLIVTANGPEASEAFGEKLAEVLGKQV